jgi:hypothetical protein
MASATLTGTITVITTSNSSHTITITITSDSGAAITTATAAVITQNGSGTGDYSISGLPAGGCKVKFTNPNLTSANSSITISLTKANTVNAVMNPKGIQY